MNYDTIHLFLPRYEISGSMGIDATHYAQYLDKIYNNKQTNIGIQIDGCLRNMRVKIKPSGISIQGSLSRFYNQSDNNLIPIPFNMVSSILEEIGDLLHIPIIRSSLLRVDFGSSFTMKYPPAVYIALLGTIPRMERLQLTKTSLMYKSNLINIAFYDKGKEMKDKKKKDFCRETRNQNILRYELRLMNPKSIIEKLKMSDITASSLCNRNFYDALVQLWLFNYQKINKNANLLGTIELNNIQTVSDAKNYILAELLISSGGQKTIDDYIVQLKNLSILKNSLSYSRLKKCLQECIATNACNSNKFIDELDEKINFHPDSFLSYGLPKFENIVSI